jgi:hypothetical protein
MNRDLDVDRISLRVTGLDPDAARTLALEVAAGLAPALTFASGDTSFARLALTVQAPDGEQPDALATSALARLAPLLNRETSR